MQNFAVLNLVIYIVTTRF